MNEARFHEPSLDEREDVLGVFFGGPKSWGGKIVVTSRRLFFAPIDVGLADSILTYVADKSGIPGADLAGTIIEKVRAAAKKEIWLRHVVAIEPHGNGGWFSAPAVKATTATGERIEFGVVKSTGTPNIHPDNRAVRDACVALLSEAVHSIKSAPPP